MSDWWNKKLKGEPVPKTQAMPPTSLRFDTVPRPQQTAPQPQQPQQQVTAQNQNLLDPNRAPNEQITMGDAIKLWKGGEAHRREGNLRCPDCGSQHVFSRTARGSNTMINGAAPAPRCFECGWNGKFSQAEQVNWA